MVVQPSHNGDSMSFDDRACDDPSSEMTDTVAALANNVEEVESLDCLYEDCWELTFTDKSGREDTVQLDDSELEVLAGMEPLIQEAWDSYVQAVGEVAREMRAECRQMGFSDF